MAKKKPPPPRGKLRTREHVIADLAVNHVERQALLGGGTVERMSHDYGVDLLLYTYAPTGEVEGDPISIQVKATERLKWLRGNSSASFRIERGNLVSWLRQLLPMILIVYDATTDQACWVHVQDYFATLPGFNLFAAGETVTVHLDGGRRWEPAAVRLLATRRDELVRRRR